MIATVSLSIGVVIGYLWGSAITLDTCIRVGSKFLDLNNVSINTEILYDALGRYSEKILNTGP